MPKYWQLTETVVRNRMHYSDLADKDEQLLAEYRECTFKPKITSSEEGSQHKSPKRVKKAVFERLSKPKEIVTIDQQIEG